MGEERFIGSQDWTIVVFAICMVLIVVAKIISRVTVADLLSTYVNDRFVNTTRTNSDGFQILNIANLMVYALCIALLIYAVITTEAIKPPNLNTYLLCLLGVSIFLLVKHYIGKIIATILGFDALLELIDLHRNIYRSMFSYALLVASIVLFLVFKLNSTTVLYTTSVVLFIFLIYNLILLNTYRQYILSAVFYFILYLCTLEIAPYLLLYKYFNGLER